ncbi:MAG: ADP-dependent glucokinase/phosphofructokinase [Opitutales bacterium]
MSTPDVWREHYRETPSLLASLPEVGPVVSAFNANVDALLRVTPERLNTWLQPFDAGFVLAEGPPEIREPVDVLRGLVTCLRRGVAAEWLVANPDVDRWMRDTLGQDGTQMGGQAGIIGNVLAVAGLPVLVHAASNPPQQAQLFADLKNLQTVGPDGTLTPARLAGREHDTAMVHLILEFQKGDTFTVGEETFTCPRSNRFIATYDPLNCGLAIEPEFAAAVESYPQPISAVVLSGYQMLTETLADGRSGLAQVNASRAVLERWRASHPKSIIHLEVASTQDLEVRRAMVEQIVPVCDSLGCNEQELAQILESLGDAERAATVSADLHGVTLTAALIDVFQRLGVERIQLHFFGMYLTVQKPAARLAPEANRAGMALAATLAAAKAGTGSLEDPASFLWAHGNDVSPLPLQELEDIAGYLESTYGQTDFARTGIFFGDTFDLIAMPTILVEKPVSLVGMGDTISALSLIGTLAASRRNP